MAVIKKSDFDVPIIDGNCVHRPIMVTKQKKVLLTVK